jgi:peptidoglycan/xylan/chitin deacetylase (PgdA/CDA1 family)
MEKIKYFFSGEEIFKSKGSTGDVSGWGNSAPYQMVDVPDGSGHRGLLAQSATNSSMTLDINVKSVLRTGNLSLQCYLDDEVVMTPGSFSGFHGISMEIQVDRTGSFSAPWYRRRVSLNRGWNHICLHRGLENPAVDLPFAGWRDGSSQNNLNYNLWSDPLSRMRIRVDGAVSGLQTRVIFTDLNDNHPFVSGMPVSVDQAEERPQVCLIFDDGFLNVYENIFPLMESLNIPAGFSIIGAFVGKKAGDQMYAPASVLQEMHSTGRWDMLNHSWEHLPVARMVSETCEFIEDQIVRCKDFLEDKGFTQNHESSIYVAPYGGAQQRDAFNYRRALEKTKVLWHYGTTPRMTGPMLRQNGFIPRLDINTFSRINGVQPTIHQILDCIWSGLMAGCSPQLMLHQIVKRAPNSGVELHVNDAMELMFALDKWRREGLCDIVLPTEFLADRSRFKNRSVG